MIKPKFDLKYFLPTEIVSGKNRNRLPLNVKEGNEYLSLWYSWPIHNWKSLAGKGQRRCSEYIKRNINKNNETFEVLGLLQAEMGKTQTGILNFSNHEYQIIKKVMAWFEKEIEIRCNDWRWYIKLNINEPINSEYKKRIEAKVTNYWLDKTKINFKNRYPTTVGYIKDTINKTLPKCYYGTLVIEIRNNILSQVIKKFVNDITNKHILESDKKEISRFMRGVIAGEANVEIHKRDKRYRVYITAKQDAERDIFERCLRKINIESKQYNYALIISKKHNLFELLQQKLLSLSPKKYNKFLRIFELYDEFPEYVIWKRQQTKPHNKIPQETIDKIIRLHHKNPDAPAWKIAEQVYVSDIKVQRVRKEHGLGKRLVKTPETKRKEIALFAEENPRLTQEQIAKHFKVHESVVGRAIKKYGVNRGNKSKYKIS